MKDCWIIQFKDTFEAVEWSLIKTFIMMIGELDYGGDLEIQFSLTF